jgi:alpha-tubulin suppressor-like RCC1 family protein
VNDGGQLGTGTTTNLSTSTPAQIASAYSNWISLGASATAIGVGAGSACALLSNSTIRCWGDNGSGQLGTGQSDQFSQGAVPSAYSAVSFPAGKSFTSIATGLGFSCARLNDGSAECWGANSAGQLGLGSTSEVGAYTPATAGLVVLPAVGVDSIFTGLGSNTCAFYGSGGGVHCWGNNTSGQLGYPDILKRGNASTNPPSNATQVPAINFGSGLSATVFSMGNAHACAILNTGELRCWGYNNAGQLGRGFTSASPDYVGGSATTTPDNAVTSVKLFP